MGSFDRMKRLIAKISVLPTDSKNDNFVLALVDYFSKEFKNNNLKTKKNKSFVKVALNGKYQDKYDSVIVDCCNGKMYLRGADCRDKYFGRLSKFNVNRKSDAYHCVNYNATRIINRINKINNSFVKEVIGDTVDMRETVAEARILDLRDTVLDTKASVLDVRENILDMRENVLDAREVVLDARTAEAETDFAVEYNTNEEFEETVDEIFNQEASNFILSDRCKEFLKAHDADSIMHLTLKEAVDSVGEEVFSSVIAKIQNATEMVFNKNFETEVKQLFYRFLMYNEDLWMNYTKYMAEKRRASKVLDTRTLVETVREKSKSILSRVASKILDLRKTIMDLR